MIFNCRFPNIALFAVFAMLLTLSAAQAQRANKKGLPKSKPAAERNGQQNAATVKRPQPPLNPPISGDHALPPPTTDLRTTINTPHPIPRKEIVAPADSDILLKESASNESPPVDSEPVVINEVRPKFTEEAITNRVEGVVIVRLLVGTDGQVKEASIVRGLPDDLDEMAIEAAYKLKFKPAMKDGKAVARWTRVSIEFRLN